MMKPERMKKLRELFELTPDEMEERTGISSKRIQHLEAGTHHINSWELTKISVLFNVTSDYLIGLSDKIGDADERQNRGMKLFIESIMKAEGADLVYGTSLVKEVSEAIHLFVTHHNKTKDFKRSLEIMKERLYRNLELV